MKAAVPSTLAERWKWRAERDPAAPRHNAPSKHRPASSPVERRSMVKEKQADEKKKPD